MKTLIKLASKNDKRGLSILLDCIVFEGNTARSTNLEQTAYTEGNWNFPVPTCVDIAKLKGALALAKKPVWEGTKLNGIELTGSSSYNAIDYPLVLSTRLDGTSKAVNVLFDDLATILNRITPAMADKDIRYYLNGVFFNLVEGAIYATDGHRLHCEQSAFEPISVTVTEVIIPRMVFDLGLKIESIKIAAQYAHITHSTGYLVTKLLEGSRLNYKRVIPSEKDKQVVEINGFQSEAIKKAVLVNKTKKSKFCGVQITTGGNLKIDDIEIPFKPDTIFNQNYGFRDLYLSEAIQANEHSTMFITPGCATDSAMFKSGNFVAVVMPMRP